MDMVTEPVLLVGHICYMDETTFMIEWIHHESINYSDTYVNQVVSVMLTNFFIGIMFTNF